ncbi:MAG: hypothetical protein NT001_03295 [Candidatus Woesearchaeota archaeon]|nr:hypothetical protein [Candidatus Woesearchaeota archaeon]
MRRTKSLNKISRLDAEVIAEEKSLAEMWEKVAEEIDPVLAARWLRRELVRVMNYGKRTFEDLKIDEKHMIELLSMVEKKEITENVAKKILEKLMEEPFSPKDYVKKSGIKAMSGASELEAFCRQAIDENPEAVEDYKKGNEKSLHYIIGQVMKKTRGQAAPSIVHEMLKKLLK